MRDALVREFFRAADSRKPQQLAMCLTEDVAWTFGNAPTTHGRAAVTEALTPLFEHVVAMSHRIVGSWTCGDCTTVETRVSYTDRFGRTFEFPGCDLLFFKDGLIREVRIFVDNHQLFLPPAPSAGQA